MRAYPQILNHVIDSKAASIAIPAPFAYLSILRGFSSGIESHRCRNAVQNVSTSLPTGSSKPVLRLLEQYSKLVKTQRIGQ
jgi:hypothetical protein